MKAFKLTAALAALLLLMCSCTNKLDYDSASNLFTDSKTGVTYNTAPMCYEACAVGDRYAAWKNDYATVDFYSIEGADPLLWLTEEGRTVFYSDKLTLPELDSMEINEVLVCVEGDKTLYAVADIFDAEHISSLISLWQTGESIDYPATTPSRSYSVKFASEKYSFMYYSLIYVEYSDGAYLYCRDTGRCVPAGNIIGDYLDGKLG